MDREHFMKCNTCGEYFDMMDLGQVFKHEHDEELPEIDGSKFIAQKQGDCVAWKDGKPINLN